VNALYGVALGGAISIVSSLVTTIVQSKLRRAERAADVREKRRQDAAALVGAMLSVLRDLDPDANVGVLRGHPRAKEVLQEKWGSLLAAQGGLEVLGATHPESDVSRLCESVVKDSTDILNRLHSAIIERRDQSDEWWENVKDLRDRAMSDARDLVRAVLEQPTF